MHRRKVEPKSSKTMAVVKVIEVLANSTRSWEDAAQTAVTQAGKSLRNIRSVYVKEFQAVVENNQITEYRINAKISFELQDSEGPEN
jgi:flavin-binding protein dodecin